MPDAPRRILVTGASGFIGRHLLTALVRRGDRPIALVRDPARLVASDDAITVVRGDLSDREALRSAVWGADGVVHLAAETRESRPEVAREVNVEGTRNLTWACREAGVRRLVALSTVAVHRRRLGPYAATKREMERVILESGLDAVILRPSLVYGPGTRGLFQRMTRLVSTLPIVPVIDRGKEMTEPVHVNDVVEAILFCLEAPHVTGQSYDLTGPEDVTLEELLRRIERTLGGPKRHVSVPKPVALIGARALAMVMKDPPVNVDNVLGAGQPTPTDPGPARRDLPLPRITLREGLPTILDPVTVPGEDGSPIRIVVIGLGRMGITHAALLSMIPGVRVAAAVDVAPRLGKALHGMGFRVPWFGSLSEAIEAARPHGAIIATPNHTHADIALLAMEQGLGVLVEKPLGHTLDSARTIAQAAEAKKVTASCGYVLAYLPIFERAKDLLDAGVIGEIERFQSSMYLSQVFGPMRGWLYDPGRSGGGVLPNLTSHLLFLLHWYFGDTEQVAATIRRLHTEVDDEATMRLRFASGLEGTVDTSWSVPGYPQSVTTITVEGANGSLHVDNLGLVVTLTEPAAGLPAGSTRVLPADLPPSERFHLVREGYSREDEDFVRALREGSPVRTSISRGLHVQAVMDAAYRSGEQGGAAVDLDLGRLGTETRAER